MLSKNQIKLINRLHQKKYRSKYGLFIVEGKKSVNEFLVSNFELENVFFTADYIEINEKNQQVRNKMKDMNDSFILVTDDELSKISALKNANQVLAVFKIPKTKKVKQNGFILILDNIKDPGNLGTIIRLCDWFGVDQLICSTATVDCYNPKVVQASMGSLTRVEVIYTSIIPYLVSAKLPIYATLLRGDNLYKSTLPKNAIIVMGNEANGISDEIKLLTTHKITIPHFSKVPNTESLNVAMATAIVLSEFKR